MNNYTSKSKLTLNNTEDKAYVTEKLANYATLILEYIESILNFPLCHNLYGQNTI